ncbi:putative arginine--tRNA ligase, cytoplasmic [Choanephora cucurbitarum]|uniref:arginine--tRNA ligase n=1 Tax=Choanephora cucurbitarum TaxID=101091 RepID=A0A1C7NAR3_9FUNG|nr:putative arginine--tRNA ligase, cytoplasmic [Choanephora cucurbitarum]
MSTLSRFRSAIAQPLSHLTQIEKSHISKLLSTPKASSTHQFSLPIPKLVAQADHKPINVAAFCQELAGKFEPNTYIEKATASGPFLQFDVQPLEYIKSTLNQVYNEKDLYGHHTEPINDKKTVVIDYSSPNIAKPFHAGHLRSTILGNFIKRVHDANGYKTIGVNYLGDWGKQYGLLAIGFELFGDSEALVKDPIHHLYQVYVKINELAKSNPDIDQKANAYFKKMEDGDEEALGQWRRFRDLSIESYKEIYHRLNIEFDHYSGESQTEPFIPKVYDLLRERSLLKITEDGAWIIDLEPYKLGKPVIRRADGTSLYMTRDLASIMLRRHLFGSFDKAVYVVGTEQELYLKQLFKICQLLEYPIDLHHANFGRVMGMSTRKGTVVFLQDILDTAKECMLENVRKSNSEMSNHQQELVADRLGASAVMIQDMLAKRVKNYEFSWNRMTAAKGYTGVYLQYTFARMCSIEAKANVPITNEADLSLLKENEAFELALTISQLSDITRSACQSMDPSVIVQYLFRLAHATSQANSALRVKGADAATAEARMLLFWAARTTLANGLHILGIDPLRRV